MSRAQERQIQSGTGLGFPACGDELAPHRVVIDRDRLERETDLAWLRSRVEEIAARRPMHDDRRLRLRATDVDEPA